MGAEVQKAQHEVAKPAAAAAAPQATASVSAAVLSPQSLIGNSALKQRAAAAGEGPAQTLLALQGAAGNRAVQRWAQNRGVPPSTSRIHRAAQAGVAGPGERLPHYRAIQRSFGPGHDLSGVRAHVGGRAARASQAMQAAAFTAGEHVGFKAAPDVWLAAHEAAHVVQQRGGVSLSGGVGRAGDRYERQADTVADRAASGRPAHDLLAGSRAAGRSAVQRCDCAIHAGCECAKGAEETADETSPAVQRNGDGGFLEQAGSALSSVVSTVSSAAGEVASEVESAVGEVASDGGGAVSIGDNTVEPDFSAAQIEAQRVDLVAQLNTAMSSVPSTGLLFTADELSSLNTNLARFSALTGCTVGLLAGAQAQDSAAVVAPPLIPVAWPVLAELAKDLGLFIAGLTLGEWILIIAVVIALIAFIVSLFYKASGRYVPDPQSKQKKEVGPKPGTGPGPEQEPGPGVDPLPPKRKPEECPSCPDGALVDGYGVWDLLHKSLPDNASQYLDRYDDDTLPRKRDKVIADRQNFIERALAEQANAAVLIACSCSGASFARAEGTKYIKDSVHAERQALPTLISKIKSWPENERAGGAMGATARTDICRRAPSWCWQTLQLAQASVLPGGRFVESAGTDFPKVPKPWDEMATEAYNNEWQNRAGMSMPLDWQEG